MKKALLQSHFERIQTMSSANEVYKCVNRTQNVNADLAFFAFAVDTAKGVNDIQHWHQYYNVAFPYGSIPVRQAGFQSEKSRSKYLFFFCFFF